MAYWSLDDIAWQKFDAGKVTVLSLDLNFTNYTNPQQFREFDKRLLTETQALPEVQLAAISGEAPR